MFFSAAAFLSYCFFYRFSLRLSFLASDLAFLTSSGESGFLTSVLSLTGSGFVFFFKGWAFSSSWEDSDSRSSEFKDLAESLSCSWMFFSAAAFLSYCFFYRFSLRLSFLASDLAFLTSSGESGFLTSVLSLTGSGFYYSVFLTTDDFSSSGMMMGFNSAIFALLSADCESSLGSVFLPNKLYSAKSLYSENYFLFVRKS